MKSRHIRLLVAALLALSLVGLRPQFSFAATTVADCPTTESALSSDISSAGSGGTVSFTCASPTTIPFNTPITITQSVTLDASGAMGAVTIDGGDKTWLLRVDSGNNVTLNALTFTRGDAGGAQSAIDNFGTLTIANSTLTGNVKSRYGSGGVIINEASATLTVSNSTFSSNYSGYGGAISNLGTLNVRSSTFSGNAAAVDSGAIDNEGTATIASSTFSGNSAPYSGGAIRNSGRVAITNSTFAGNSSGTSSSNTGTGVIDNVLNSGTVSIQASILANSTPGGNCSGHITDDAYNLTDSHGDCGLTGSTDLTNTDPKLNSLANNGGPTQTMALQSTSPAIDLIAKITGYCPPVDQRGAPRPDDNEDFCDIGAYELGDSTAPTTTISLNPAQPDGSNTWYTSSVTASVSATDPDNTASTLTTRCVLDPTAVPTSFSDLPSGSCAYAVSGGANISGDGVHTLYAASEDPASNIESPVQSSSFKIDATLPTITDQADSCSNTGSNGWCRGTETSTFAYSDATSGLAAPCTAAAGTTCTQAVSSTGDGSAVTLSSGSDQDVAGNTTSAITSGPFKIDATPPTVTCGSTPTFTLNQTGASVSATVSDATSGPAVTTVSGAATTSAVGSFATSVTGSDNAGNTTAISCPYLVAYKVQQAARTNTAGRLAATVQLQDYNGANLSSPGIAVRALKIVNGSGTTVKTLNAPFTFLAKAPAGFVGAAYTYATSTGLPKDTYSLVYQAGNDPTMHSLSFTI